MVHHEEACQGFKLDKIDLNSCNACAYHIECIHVLFLAMHWHCITLVASQGSKSHFEKDIHAKYDISSLQE